MTYVRVSDIYLTESCVLVFLIAHEGFCSSHILGDSTKCFSESKQRQPRPFVSVSESFIVLQKAMSVGHRLSSREETIGTYFTQCSRG